MHTCFVLIRTAATLHKTSSTVFFSSLIHTHSTSPARCGLLLNQDQLRGLPLSLRLLLHHRFGVSGWLTQGGGTRVKGYGRVLGCPPKTLVLSSGSRQVLVCRGKRARVHFVTDVKCFPWVSLNPARSVSA